MKLQDSKTFAKACNRYVSWTDNKCYYYNIFEHALRFSKITSYTSQNIYTKNITEDTLKVAAMMYMYIIAPPQEQYTFIRDYYKNLLDFTSPRRILSKS